ncbi:MAG TPA: hypothetical protein VG649_03095 [Candidatus Angelobacter sp.]|jgi:hypothetical protein|nr:hypothetical protein [Candidatus Angelobacter sp.]
MSRIKIFATFVAIDLLIMGGILWGVFHHAPLRQLLLPGFGLFFLNGLWLVWMTVRSSRN